MYHRCLCPSDDHHYADLYHHHHLDNDHDDQMKTIFLKSSSTETGNIEITLDLRNFGQSCLVKS